MKLPRLTTSSILSCVSALALTAGLAAVAHAQEAAAPADNTVEVVVTAQKRSQRLIDVPMGITAVGGEELKKKGIESIQDLSFQVPGLTMREDGPGSYTVFIRGLANQSGSGALVSLYLNEAPLSLSGYDQLSPVALDLKRIEVLKGPQGTLYGQGSAGGTIRYITNDPNLSHYSASVEAEGYGVAHGEAGGKVTGVVNLPLIEDKLALRLAGSYESGGGWIDQPEAGIENGNGTELTNLRATLLWKPTENFDAKAMIQTHRAETELGMGYEEADRTVDIGMDPSIVLIPKVFNFDVYNVELNYNLGFAKLTSATTFIDHHHEYPFTYIPREGNYSYGYVEGNDERYVSAKQFTQEVRLSSSGKPFEWTVGAYYADSQRRMDDYYAYLYAGAGDLYSGGGVLIDNLYYLSESTSKNYSIFADGAYQITDKLSVGGGIRYFHDEQTSLIVYGIPTGSEPVLEDTFESVDPRVYIAYKLAPKTNLYASISKGFRSGGFNSAPFDAYKPEKVMTYEIGAKGVVAGGKVQFDVATFFTQYSDMVRRRLTQVDGAYLSESSNIGEVEIKGIEGSIAWKATEHLTLTANAAYLDSVITETSATDQVNIVGDRVDYTPKYSYTLGANYNFDWTPNVPGFARIDYSHRDAVSYIDRSSFAPSALPQWSDALDLVNARIGATAGSVTYELYATNLFDQNKSIDPYQGWANANRTRPRVIGVKVGYSY